MITTRTVKQWAMHPYRGENELGAEVKLEPGEQVIYVSDRDGGGVTVREIVIGRLAVMRTDK